MTDDQLMKDLTVVSGQRFNRARDRRQAQVYTWAKAAFGKSHVVSIEQRSIRFLEEAIELAQSGGCTEEIAHKLVSFVFARPVGTMASEIGGVGITLLCLAQAAHMSADECEVAEFLRVLDKPLEHFAARNKAKNQAGFNVVKGKKT